MTAGRATGTLADSGGARRRWAKLVRRVARQPTTLEGCRASSRPYALAAGFWRKLIPIRLNAFIAAMVIVRSTRSLGSNAADAAS